MTLADLSACFSANSLLVLLALLALFLGWRWRRASVRLEAKRTELQQARDAARANAERSATLARYLAAAAAVSANSILLLDQNKTVLWLNDAARHFCREGISPPLPLRQAVHSFELLEVVEQAVKQPHPSERQFTRGGNSFHAVAMRTGSDAGLIALTITDITELQRLGRARRDFVANISHDLRTPIAAIQVMVETLQGSASDHAKHRHKLLAGIADQTATLQQLAEEMLELSLIESGRLPLRLVETLAADLVDPVVERMAAQSEHRRITLTTQVEPGLRVLADPDSIRRVLQNLLHNAIKFSGEGGKVLLAAAAAGEDARFMVQDNGPGIDPEDLDRVFERFYKADRTRSEGGTGLGLAIAKHIVEGHSGRVWVESRLGEGAAFYFTLPRA